MVKFILNMQISRRLLFAFLLAALIPGMIILLLGLGFIHVQKSRNQATQVDIQAFQVVAASGSTLPALLEQLRSVYQSHYSMVPDQQSQLPDLLKKLRNSTMSFTNAVKTYKRNYQIDTALGMRSVYNTLLKDDANVSLIKRQHLAIDRMVNKLWPDYQQAQNSLLNAIAANIPKEQAAPLLQQVTDKYVVLEPGWDNITEITQDIGIAVAQVNTEQTGPFLLATMVALASTILIVTIIGYLIYLTIARPLHHLADLTKRIAKGETSARATIVGQDEISLVARSINHMLDYIMQLIREAQTQRDQMQIRIETLVNEVSGAAGGDLRLQAQVTTDVMGVLADSFNYMVDQLGSLVIQVKMVAKEVDATTTSTLGRMSQLVEMDKAQLKQIAAATTQVELMTSASRRVAERAQALRNVARLAGQDAQKGREAVKKTVLGMELINENVQSTADKVHNLDERSREIDEIVDVISAIAQQTERLAISSAVQAELAGEYGKGFEAIAVDIRRLAERTKQEASRITRSVRAVREDIETVARSMHNTKQQMMQDTDLAEETGNALESIFAAVDHQAHETENISQMVLQQLQSANAVMQIMQGVSAATRQNSLNTRQGSQSVERLGHLVKQLRVSVDAFKLHEDPAYYIPNSQMSANDDLDNSLTVSSALRAVTTISQPLPMITPDPNFYSDSQLSPDKGILTGTGPIHASWY